MELPLGKKRFIDAIRVERARWEMLLLRVGERRMYTPVCGQGLSVADMVEEVYERERWLIGRLCSTQGASVSLIGAPTDRVEASRQAFNEIVQLLIPVPEADLFAEGCFAWLQGHTLAEVVAACTVDYYLAHDPPIRTWLAQPLVQAC